MAHSVQGGVCPVNDEVLLPLCILQVLTATSSDSPCQSWSPALIPSDAIFSSLSVLYFLLFFIYVFPSATPAYYGMGLEICNAFGYEEQNYALTLSLTGTCLASEEMLTTLCLKTPWPSEPEAHGLSLGFCTKCQESEHQVQQRGLCEMTLKERVIHREGSLPIGPVTKP